MFVRHPFATEGTENAVLAVCAQQLRLLGGLNLSKPSRSKSLEVSVPVHCRL